MLRLGGKNCAELVGCSNWFSLICVTFVFLVIANPAYSNSSIPKVCHQRAVDIGIFKSGTTISPKNKSTELLRISEKYFLDTLDHLESEIQNDQSSTFQYLIQCASSQNGRKCHHFYKQNETDPAFWIEKNTLYLDVYCAPKIEQWVTQTAVSTLENLIQTCSSEPTIIEGDTLNNQSPVANSPCYKRQTLAGESYWVNKQDELTHDLNQIQNNLPENKLKQAVQSSLIPEAMDFILRKSNEEFEMLDQRNEINSFFKSYYAYIDMLSELLSLTGSNYQPDFQMSVENTKSIASLIRKNLPQMKFLTFTPSNILTQNFFYQAELNYWKNKMRNSSPLQFSIAEQQNYYHFLQKDPLLYSQRNNDGFNNLKISAKDKKNLPHTTSTIPSIVQSIGSAPYVARESTKPTTQNLQLREALAKEDFFQRFSSDPNFQSSYLNNFDLANDREFENFKSSFSPTFMRSFLPYAIARVARTKLIREIQKRNDISSLLQHPNPFSNWADTSICINWKSTPPFYCGNKFLSFRKKMYERLRLELSSNPSLINKESEKNAKSKKFLLDSVFADKLNDSITRINQYCQRIANPNAFKKDPSSFRSKTLDSLLYKLYSIPQIKDLLNQQAFTNALDADSNNYRESCFVQGKIFGPSLETSSLVRKKMSTPKGKGNLVSNGRYGYQGNLFPSLQEAYQGLTFQQIYLPSKFFISESTLRGIEEKIEKSLQNEMVDLQHAWDLIFTKRTTTADNIQEFLQDATFKHLPAMMDYALDHPSQNMGKLIKTWILKGNVSEETKMRNIGLVTNGLLIVGTILPFAKLPAMTASGFQAVMYSTGGIALTLASISVGSALYQLYLLNQRELASERASLIGNLFPGQNKYLQSAYDSKKNAVYGDIAWAVGLTVVFATKPIAQSLQFSKRYLTDKAFNLAWKTRGIELENFIRNNNYSIKYTFQKELMDLVRDSNVMTNRQFRELMKSFYRGDYEEFLHETLSPILKQKNLKLQITSPSSALTPKEIFSKKISIGLTSDLPTLSTQLSNYAKYPFVKTADIIADQQWFIRTRTYYLQHIRQYLNPLRWKGMSNKYRLNWEKSLVTFVDDARKTPNGVAVFTQQAVDDIGLRLKYFEFSDGKFILKADPNLIGMLEKLNLRPDLFEYLRPALMGELLSKKKIDIVIRIFNRPLDTMDDCKAFLKVLKYINRDFSGLDILTKAAVDFNRKIEARFYRINEFYDWAKFKKYESNLRIIQFIRRNKTTWGLSDDEIHGIIYRYNRNFDYKLRNSPEYFNEANQYVNSMIHKIRPAMADEELAPFLREETDIANLFHEKLQKSLSKGSSFDIAFSNALSETSIYKHIYNECSLPNSIARKKIDKMYVNYAQSISIASTFFSYIMNHYNEEKNFEWYTRIAYDMTLPAILSRMVALKFTGSATTTWMKILASPVTSIPGYTVDAFGYNFMTQHVWDVGKVESQFEKYLYQSSNPSEMAQKYLSTHPEVGANLVSAGKKLNHIFEKINKEGIENIPEDQIISEFTNANLVEEYSFDKMKNADNEHGENYIYHELLKNNIITPDMFPSQSLDDQEQLFRIIENDMYRNLYDHKGTKVSLPFAGQVDLGDWDWMEIQAGNNNILKHSPLTAEATDRFLFNITETTATSIPVFARSQMVYSVLCKQRFLPGKLGLISPLIIHAVYKAVMEPTKYTFRNQMTGH